MNAHGRVLWVSELVVGYEKKPVLNGISIAVGAGGRAILHYMVRAL